MIFNGVNDNDLTCDFTDAVMTINDNQMHSLFFVDPTTGEVPEIKYGDHAAIKQRKIRQLKSILPSAGPVDDNKHFS